MLQLAYISSAKMAVTPAVLDNILDVSRRNNESCEVTGLLVVGGRRFLQVLEGPEQSVLATYARIQADDRHRACVLLESKIVEERAFGCWSMASDASSRPGQELEGLVTTLVAKIADRNLRAQFTGFARLHSQAA